MDDIHPNISVLMHPMLPGTFIVMLVIVFALCGIGNDYLKVSGKVGKCNGQLNSSEEVVAP